MSEVWYTCAVGDGFWSTIRLYGLFPNEREAAAYARDRFGANFRLVQVDIEKTARKDAG